MTGETATQGERDANMRRKAEAYRAKRALPPHPDDEKLITVCIVCHRACCAQKEHLCARGLPPKQDKTALKTVRVLRGLSLENPANWARG